MFSTTLGQVLVMISMPTHYALGFLLVLAIRPASARQADRSAAGAFLPAVPDPHRTG